MKNQSGFTLIELVIVIVLLGVLSAIAVPRFVNLEDDAQDERAGDDRQVRAIQGRAQITDGGQLRRKSVSQRRNCFLCRVIRRYSKNKSRAICTCSCFLTVFLKAQNRGRRGIFPFAANIPILTFLKAGGAKAINSWRTALIGRQQRLCPQDIFSAPLFPPL